jgi:hypothetical protein
MEELLKTIPPEKCWAITAKNLWRFLVLGGAKTVLPLLGKDEGVFAPVWGWEKWGEINAKVMGESVKQLYQMTKEMFSIPVEDAIGAAKLDIVAMLLWVGPDYTIEIVEATSERVVIRTTRCPLWEVYVELKVHPELTVGCHGAHQTACEEGLKAVNPKLTCKFTKARGWGDPYCEWVLEFKD